MEIKRIDREQIKESLREKGYAGKSISYEELQELYAEYGQGMSEADFAQVILGISYTSYSGVKNLRKKAKILKDKKEKFTQEEIGRIVEKLKEVGYEEKAITYEELQELYKQYGNGMGEVKFAQAVLGVSEANYRECKYGRKKTKVLKDKQKKLPQEELEKIIESLRKRGYAGKSIRYEEIHELWTEYGNGLAEADFAQLILGMSYSGYMNCKHQGARTRVLKDRQRKLPQEEVEKIVESLRKRGYAGKLMSYEELLELWKEYGNGTDEITFAQSVLGISYSAYTQCKSRGSRTKVLKGEIVKLSQEEIEEIIKCIKERGYAGKLITHEELQQLYKEYGKGCKETEFAQILGISYNSYIFSKKNNSKMKVLKDEKMELSQKEVEKIVKSIKERGYIGKSISYEELQELYREYGNKIKEAELAKILGISYGNYMNCKNKKTRAIIRDGTVIDKVKEIMILYLGKPDWYSRDFLNHICKEYDITFEDFITYVGLKGLFDSSITESLRQKDKIWIGKMRISEEFVNTNVGLIQDVAIHTANSVCKRYGKKDRKDYVQEVIVYIIENMGAVEKNFGENLKLFRDIIFKSAKKYCENMIRNELSVSKKVQFGRLIVKVKNGEKIERQIEDERVNIEEQVVESETKSDFLVESERCIKLLSQYIEAGFNRSEALEMTSQEMGIDAEKMLEYMQQYLVTKGKVKITRKGTVEWEVK